MIAEIALVPLFKQTFSKWLTDNCPKLGASLAFYTLLSLAPLLVLAVAIAGFAFGEEAARGQIVWQIDEFVGSDAAKFVQDLLQNARRPDVGSVATALGLFTLLFAASGVFTELRDSLDTIWGVRPPWSGLFAEIKARFFSFAMVLGVGFLLLVSLILSAGLAAAGKYVGDRLPVPAPVLSVANLLISLAFITLLFAMIYKILPHARIAWNDVWIGAAVTALLFSLGKFLIGMYLGKAAVGSAFGAAGSLVVLVVWVYYSAQIFFFGAEFTQVYANAYGSHVVARHQLRSRVGANPKVPV
jgi:membrane protein